MTKKQNEMIKTALKLTQKKELEAFDNLPDYNIELSDDLEHSIDELSRRDFSLKKRLKTAAIRRVAIILAAVFVFTLSTIHISAGRGPVIREYRELYIFGQYHDNPNEIPLEVIIADGDYKTGYSIHGSFADDYLNGEPIIADFVDEIYLPEGYELSSLEEVEDRAFAEWTNESGDSIYLIKRRFVFDYIFCYKTVEVNDIEVPFCVEANDIQVPFYYDGRYRFLWKNNDYYYILTCETSISMIDVVKIISSVGVDGEP